jgi:large subunit ribosomal protein L30
MSKKIVVKQIRSTIRQHRRQLETLKCLGLGRIGNEVEHVVNPSVVGMIKKVRHLVDVKEAK